MPTCAMSPVDSKKRPDYFQRRKVGSIRDNPKLLKIRQQFENACQEPISAKRLSKAKVVGGSAPSSVSFRKNGNAFVIDQLLKIDAKLDKTETFLATQTRRNSEGDLKDHKPFVIYENSPKITHKEFKSSESICSPSAEATSLLSNSLSSFSLLCSPNRLNRDDKDGFSKKYLAQNSSSESGACTNSSTSESICSPSTEPNLSSTSLSSFSLRCSPSRLSRDEKDGFSKKYSTQNSMSESGMCKNSPASESICSPNTESTSLLSSFSLRSSPNRSSRDDKDSFNQKYLAQNSSSESGVCTNSSASEEDCVSSHYRPFRGPAVDESSNKFFRFLTEDAPPIPRRGISPAVQNSFVHSRLNRKNSSTSSLGSQKSNNNVQMAIELYEGMSSIDLKRNKATLRRDDSTSSRRSFLLRRNSRRSSLRKSRHFHDKDDPPSTSSSTAKKKETTYKDNSGVVMDDQNIYQTLTTTINITRTEFNPYDRLNRLHDAVNRIHKGESSNCAACKAIPSSVLSMRTDDSNFMQIKCNESAPHHHPPCICFACQHSIFTCSEEDNPQQPSAAETVNKDSLYYNVCCLNSPNRKSWRESRRRPVCEQNGRLCIVNCDMEKCCAEPKKPDEYYANLSECRSSTRQRRDPSRHISGDSCDSDEGWVDITDSEDEKSLVANKRSAASEGIYSNSCLSSAIQNASYDIDRLMLKYTDLDISRAASTEHLYESIADIDTLSDENNTIKEQNSPNDSIAGSIKGDQNPENDLDSGEWSTESASPTFDESTNSKDGGQEQKSFTSNQYRFTVNSESQETAKKTFMKSVLGKKAVPSKKRRMSNFFVPWLVSSQEYESTKTHKSRLQKQGSRSPKSPFKSKRSQSTPTVVSPKITISCTKGTMSSSDLLESFRSKDGDSEDNNLLSPDGPPSVCSRESVASSAYLRSDQITSNDTVKSKTCVSTEPAVEVVVERVHKRSPSGNSDHSYIMFQPVKEEDVPLYQFYERNMKERVSFCRSPKSLSPIMWSGANESCSSIESGSKPAVPQFSVVEQLSPDAQDMKMLWCELPEVKESGILERISAQELKLQEAIFDFIQSQASYIRSLKVLFENFVRTPAFSGFESPSCVLSKHEHDVLFSDIVRVMEVSMGLMKEITQRWDDGIMIPDICDIIHRHAEQPTFSVYVKYCSNRVYQERTLKELKETRLCFLEVLRKLESNPVCQGLSLESFLFLPMQHISRLPLLLDNIFRWLVPESPSYGICKTALEAVHKVFIDCNEGARKMERLEEMFVLQKQLEFKECKVVPLISASRWLLKKGELTKLEFDKKTFGRSNRCIRVPIYLFLFNDVLVITKKKNDDCYSVVDYCAREKVQAMVVNSKDLQQPVVVPNTCRYLLYLTLFNNHQGSAVDMILNCTLLSERTRWIEAIQNVPQNKPCEVWEYDCPQVQCVRSYIAQQPDELSLQESDVVTVHRKMNDGWYEGRRLRDGLQGWFPASYTMDIPCSRARASNLRQCYRLLMLSQTQ